MLQSFNLLLQYATRDVSVVCIWCVCVPRLAALSSSLHQKMQKTRVQLQAPFAGSATNPIEFCFISFLCALLQMHIQLSNTHTPAHTNSHTSTGIETNICICCSPACTSARIVPRSLSLPFSLSHDIFPVFFAEPQLSLALALGLSPAPTSSLPASVPVAVLGFKPNVPHLCCTYFASCVRLCVCVFMQYYSYYTHTRTRSHINISL